MKGFTNLAEAVPFMVADLRYATHNNVCGQPISEFLQPFLRNDAAQDFVKAAAVFRDRGYKVVVWDALRSEATQRKLQTISKDEAYVSKRSNHVLGIAIDMTLAGADGQVLDMGTGFDVFAPMAAVAAPVTPEQRQNRQILSSVMEQNGFRQLATEWWHFDYTGGVND